MLTFFTTSDPKVQAAYIAAAVSIVTVLLGSLGKYSLEKSSLNHKLKTEYNYEQKKKQQELIGRFYGRIVEASEKLNHRLFNLYENESRGWMNLSNNEFSYYYISTIYRFLQVLSLVRLFEKEAIYIDPRVGRQQDLHLLKFLKALQWASTDVKLFDEITYDISKPVDHFFNDELRSMCDYFVKKDDDLMGLDEFRNEIKKRNGKFKRVADFFYDIKKNETRLRWDRIVSIHLILVALINTFGYDVHKTKPDQIQKIASMIQNKKVLDNLEKWIPKLGLGKQKEAQLIVRVVRAIKMNK